MPPPTPLLHPDGSPPAAPDAVFALGRPLRRRSPLRLILAAAVPVAIALGILHDQVSYYRITSASMLPTLPVGVRVAVEAGVPLKVGEIIAFYGPAGALALSPVCGAPGEGTGFQKPCGLATPASSSTVLVKRIVAGPGDFVSIRAGHAIVDDLTASEPYAAPCGGAPGCDFPEAIRVPPGAYYLLGDNRGNSDDSRFWGPVPGTAIIGVVVTCHPLQTACRPLS